MISALLFPGQGAQHPDMLAFVAGDPSLHPLIEDLRSVLGTTIRELDSPIALQHSRNVQLALFVAGVACFRQLEALGARIDFVAGFSIGTFSAAVACGAYTFRELLPVVAIRGDRMEKAYPTGYGMLAVVGPRTKEIALAVARDASLKGRAYLANVNSANQIVFAGERTALKRVALHAEALGSISIQFLKVPVPSHCPLLSGVAQELQLALSTVPAVKPRIPYLSNLTTRLVSDEVSIQLDLAENVAHSIDWHSGIELLRETGVDVFVEATPGDTLTRLGEQTSSNAFALRISVLQKGLKAAAKALSSC